uniref:(northern house mosquito) hypothetical protein n=1 Tax=Culex pipiens TaxID=7175 RepID=A0A8D8AD01_CULPI
MTRSILVWLFSLFVLKRKLKLKKFNFGNVQTLHQYRNLPSIQFVRNLRTDPILIVFCNFNSFKKQTSSVMMKKCHNSNEFLYIYVEQELTRILKNENIKIA